MKPDIIPGQAPFRAGIHPDMYRGRPWTVRQLAGGGTPEQVNARIRFLLSSGATGISVLFDVPTIQMYDSDEPESIGMVGVVGAPVDTVDDMDAVFRGIALDEVSVSLVTHYPSNTAALMGMYLALAERRGIPWAALRGSVQNDMVMEEVVRSAPEFIPPAACFQVQLDNIAFLLEHCPKWNVATFNGYNLREFGADIILESAVALVNAYETQLHLPAARDRLAFFWCIGSSFFDEIARLRAVREVWWNLTKGKLRCHCQTSGISLSRFEPLNNIVRAGYQAMAAVLGGCQSLHVDGFDEAYSTPSAQAALLGLRTQQILQVETGIMDTPDPLGGAPYIEAQTDMMVAAIQKKFDLVRMMHGGIVGAVESGWLRQQCLEGQTTPVPTVPVMPDTMDIEPLLPVGKAVVRSPHQPIPWDGNLISTCIAAAREGASLGEMRRACLKGYGRWERP